MDPVGVGGIAAGAASAVVGRLAADGLIEVVDGLIAVVDILARSGISAMIAAPVVSGSLAVLDLLAAADPLSLLSA